MAGESYTFATLRSFWLGAGGSVQWADTMAAIALAESGGCRYALAGPRDIRPVKACVYRHTTSENSVGLWQINLFAHPQYDEFALFDPHANAVAAVAVLGHGTPTPWSTYLNGAYLPYLAAGGGGKPGPRATPRAKPHAKHRTTPLHLPAGVAAPGERAPRPGNVVNNWKFLTLALGSVLPSQDVHARVAIKQFRRALR